MPVPVFAPLQLREARDSQELSRPALARRTGLSPLTIRDYEYGRRFPSAPALGRLAAGLGCSVDAFFASPADGRAPDAA
ncbi:helix-turn-helix domain-containing protein [Actinomycetospora sp.]|uniref:helix-turn-helix domain-containing protein n=1 Tax=Actinomycetospora sp. TaxID=1872135 RepID=UPI0039C8A7F0